MPPPIPPPPIPIAEAEVAKTIIALATSIAPNTPLRVVIDHLEVLPCVTHQNFDDDPHEGPATNGPGLPPRPIFLDCAPITLRYAVYDYRIGRNHVETV